MTLTDILILVLLFGWGGGLAFGILGSAIHILLVIALVMFVFRLLSRT